jgi:CHAD domain-containing protein
MRLRRRVVNLEHHLQQAMAQLNVAITPEGIHAARVAVRRLRVLLRAYRGDFNAAAAKEFKIILKQFTRDLEKAREANVLERGLARLTGNGGGPVSSASRTLNGRAAKAFELAVSELRIIVAGAAWREALRHLGELSTWPSLIRENDRSATKVQNRLLKRARSRLRHAVGHARKNPAKLHRVRLKVKAARYLLEDSLSKQMMQRSSELKLLRKLQDCLGDFHDEENLDKTIRRAIYHVPAIRAKIKGRKRQHLLAYKTHSRALLELWDRAS